VTSQKLYLVLWNKSAAENKQNNTKIPPHTATGVIQLSSANKPKNNLLKLSTNSYNSSDLFQLGKRIKMRAFFLTLIDAGTRWRHWAVM